MDKLTIRNLGLAAAVTVLASACLATTPTTRDATVGAATEVVEDDGMVVVQVAVNGERVVPRFTYWHTIMLRNTLDPDVPGEKPKYHYLRPVNSLSAGTRVYAGTLPEGNYRLINFFSIYHDGNYTAWSRAPVPPTVGDFEVGSGQITDLGTLVFQPVVTDERWGYAVARSKPQASNVDYLESRFPDVTAQLTQAEILTWNENELDIVNQDLIQAIMPVAHVTAPLVFLDDGRVLRAGRLGQILVRETSGEWRQVDTGLDTTITSLAHVPGEGYYATSESGLILHAAALDGDWTIQRLTAIDSVVLALTRGADGYLHVLAASADVVEVPDERRRLARGPTRTERYDVVRVYRGDDLDGGTWTTVWDHRLPTRGRLPQAFVEDGVFIVAMGGQGIVRYDIATGEVERHRAPPGAVQPGPGGIWTGFSPGLRAGRHAAYVSEDGGRRWTGYRDPLHYGYGWPARLPDGEILVPGRGFFRDPHTRRVREADVPIQLYERIGRETWRPWSPLPDKCGERIGLQVQGRENLWVTCDNGTTYRIELATRELYVERYVDFTGLMDKIGITEGSGETPDDGTI